MSQNTLELYVHIPFCVKKCAYCDFLSFPAAEAVREQYVQKLCEEIRAAKKEALEEERCVSSVFFGGGTPSLLEPRQIGVILNTARECYEFQRDAEISMEMNPGTLGEGDEELRRLLEYRAAGVNRISLGLQSADNEELRLLGRIHTWEQFLQSFQCARQAGFTNVNVDLMSALPEQTLKKWERSLRMVAELEPEHISAYSLIIEEGTPFFERYTGKGETLLPDEDTERAMYMRTEEILREYGYSRYEISNYAKEARECRHNLGYWTGVDYLGFGLGASSYYQGYRFANTDKLQEYLSADFLMEPNEIRRERHWVTESERMEEFMFLGLRLMKGVSASAFLEQFGRKIEDVYGKQLETFIQLGLIERYLQKQADTCTQKREVTEEERYYRLTTEGISVSNQVMCEFLEPEIDEK